MWPASPKRLILALSAVIAAAALAGCKRAPEHPLSQVEVSGGTMRDNALLGMTPPSVEAALLAAIKAHPRLGVLPQDAKESERAKAASLKLELAFTREAQKEGRPGRWAEVGATLSIRRKEGLESYHYEVVGMGEAQVEEDGDRPRAMRAAFDSALEQVITAADLQLAALRKSDDALLADLKVSDPRTQELALRVLAERRNPAVGGALVERLKSSRDPETVRKWMGALSEMREQRAVKPLIDLTRGQDPIFVREIVFALAQIGGEEAMAYLFTVAQGHDDPQVREAARRAMSEVEWKQRGGDARSHADGSQ